MDLYKNWDSCLAEPNRDIAFFDGIRITTDKISDSRWDRVLPILEEEQVFMCRAMRSQDLLKPGLKVLDIGTGSGVFAIWAAAHGCKVTAIDLSPRSIFFAKNNLSDPSNASLMKRNDGSVIVEEISIEKFSERDESFDIIFINAPYNPTAPGVSPALHASAGPVGLNIYSEQLPLAWRLLKPNGVIIGNQMCFHDKGSGSEWWSQVLQEKCPSEAGYVPSVKFSPILSEHEYSARSFLEQQYKHFLNSELNRTPSSKEIRKYIEDTVGAAATSREKVFSLYYFEITKENKKSSVERIIFKDIIPPKTWMDRIFLHRQIIEHTSAPNSFSFPVPALFLRNGLAHVSALFLDNKSTTSSQKEHRPEDSFKNSPLQKVLSWIRQIEITHEHKHKLDFVLIDFGPWIESNDKSGLANEAFFCCKKKLGVKPRSFIEDYQKNTICHQKLSIAPLLHPAFTGDTASDAWTGLQFQILHSDKPPLSTSDRQQLKLIKKWSEDLEKTFITCLSKSSENIVSDDNTGNFDDFIYAYDSLTLKDLSVPDQSNYINRIFNDYEELNNGNFFEKESSKLMRKDLESVHTVFHQRLRKLISKNIEGEISKDYCTFLIGIPINFATVSKAEPKEKKSQISENYRGGLWI
ncbi:MAG: class I SAM-dependent methyltransferase, partial [Candidatus Electrothrix sp. MAN1_4]|nr:class I SAM-dependent methyltransferase [Candidatus Electrothrix sp. MAN1_4]